MSYKRVLTIQDISCVGQCSLTVALPIISACGSETAVLPSAVLSTHTAGFTGYTVRDLTDDFPAIEKHWNKEGLKFDAIYTGYLGSTKQVKYVESIMNSAAKEKCVKIVDPAMADNGALYPAFDKKYVKAMAGLCGKADIVLPNITEACFLTGTEYKENYDKTYIVSLCKALKALGAKKVVLTGVGYEEGRTGVVVYGTKYEYYEHEKMTRGSHGTGDVYASAFTGALMAGRKIFDAARIAADYTLTCIKHSQKGGNFYGVKFEPELGLLIDLINK